MLTTRRCTILAAGVLLGLVGLGIPLNTALAGKSPPPPKPVPWPYTITFLGTLGGNFSIATSVNSSGAVVGYAETSPYIAPWWPEESRKWQVAFVWTAESGMQNLNDLLAPADRPHWYLTDANDINDSGQIVGSAVHDGVSPRAYRYTPASSSSGPTIEDLGTLGRGDSLAGSINNAGDCCGLYWDAAGNMRSFLYTFSISSQTWVMYDIGDLGATPVTDINSGQINSSLQICGSLRVWGVGIHAFLYVPPGPMYDLGVFGVNRSGKYRISESRGYDINDSGVVVGKSTTGSGVIHAYKYTTGMIDLGTLGGPGSDAQGINNSGWIVGKSNLASGTTHLFLYTPDKGMMDLEAAIQNLPPGMSGKLIYGISRISDSGVICGTNEIANGTPVQEAFILTR